MLVNEISSNVKFKLKLILANFKRFTKKISLDNVKRKAKNDSAATAPNI